MSTPAANANRDHGSGPTSHAPIDPVALMRIKDLHLRAKAVVEGFFSGLHRSPFHGFSVEFSEYREYTPGDDPRYLDWRLYARSDRFYIKRFEDETNLRCHLLVDFSRSMAYDEQGYSKSEYARTIAATLAYFLHGQRDAVGLMTFHSAIIDQIPPRFRSRQLQRIFRALETVPAGDDTDLGMPLEQVASNVNRRGLIVLISDLLTPTDQLRKQLAALSGQGHEVVIFRVLDPTEVSFAFQRPAQFQDIETGRERYVDPDHVRRTYLERFEQHQQSIIEICSDLGIDLHLLQTSQPVELVLFDFLSGRLRKGRSKQSTVHSNSAGLRGGRLA